MDSSKLSALFLILLLSISSTPMTLACSYCPPRYRAPPPPSPPMARPPPPPKAHPPPPPKARPPPPPTPSPPTGPIYLPPITLPPVVLPPITLPPIIGGPIVGNVPSSPPPPATGRGSCPPPPGTSEFCPLDALKLGVCVDVLGLVDVHLGDPAVTCCPLLTGLTGLQAALCLCTTIRAKLLDINVFLPLALQVLITCGNAAPAGYTCPY